MRPVSRPTFNCSEPRVAEICCSDWMLKLIGSAPYLSWSARALAWSSVKLPVICDLPSEITAWDVGEDSTLPSSIIANRLRGSAGFCPRIEFRREVTSLKVVTPWSLNSMFTPQRPVVTPWPLLSWECEAVAISLPLSSTRPRMYFSVPSVEQATIGFPGSWFSASSLCPAVQSFASYSFCNSAVIQFLSELSLGSASGLGSLSSGVRLSCGVAAPEPEASTGRNDIFAEA